jgi:arsenate reductase
MKKAFAWLESNHTNTRFTITELGAPVDKLKAWCKQHGWECFLNVKGNTFRQLPPARQQGLNSSKALALMQEVPSIIKRPVIEGGKSLLIGFDPEAYRAALK